MVLSLSGGLLALSACRVGLTPPTPTEVVPAPTPVATESKEVEEAMPTPTPGEGLSYEEFRRTTPPPPQSLQAEALEEGILLKWSAPEAVESPHNYSDQIIHYNIYRRTEDTDFQLLDSTSCSCLSYLDRAVKAGVTYYYAVSAVHEGPAEGERTEEVSVTAIGP